MTARGLHSALGALLLAVTAIAHATMSGMPYPRAIAPGVYAFFGDGEAVAPANHGIVANNGFIVGESGVTVIDTGPSYRYGRAMIEAIREVTPLPIKLVVITHQAPEFVFGAAAFRDHGVSILAHARAAQSIRERCSICLANLRKTLGEVEMADSRVTVPDKTVDGTTEIESGGRKLKLLHFGPASTPGDLAVLDLQTGVLFAGGLVSNGRIPELRNEQISGWLAALESLHTLKLRAVVPGFGPPLDSDGIMQTDVYLRELDASVKRAYRRGLSLIDAMHTVQLPAFSGYKLYAIAQPQNVQRIYLQLEKP